MKKAGVALLLILAALALAACGGGGNTTTEETAAGGAAETEEGGAAEEAGGEEEGAAEAGGGGTVKFEANPEGQLAFEEKSATATAGQNTIEFTNESSVPHDVKIEDSAGKEIGGTEVVSGGSDTATVELEPGTYTFYCSIPGHRQAGMEGTLTVK